MAAKGAYLVPTLVTYRADQANGPKIGFTPETPEKNMQVLEAGTRSLEIAAKGGPASRLPTAPISPIHPRPHQPEEFLVRAEVQKPADIISQRHRDRRRGGADGRQDRRGQGGAFADLLVIDGDPLSNLGLFQNNGEHISAVMRMMSSCAAGCSAGKYRANRSAGREERGRRRRTCFCKSE